jgi:hypothetical protein
MVETSYLLGFLRSGKTTRHVMLDTSMVCHKSYRAHSFRRSVDGRKDRNKEGRDSSRRRRRGRRRKDPPLPHHRCLTSSSNGMNRWNPLMETLSQGSAAVFSGNWAVAGDELGMW